jgi:D-glycero-alpha-D-manno-heptose 1-phosphate guanylyltransferase
MNKSIAVLILAGGYGTRLSSIVADRPKVLAEVNGRPFLSYLLDQLGIVEVTSVIVCSGYKGEMIFHAFQDRYKSMKLIYSQEPNPLGTAGALKLALEYCSAEYLLVMNGDSYCDADISSFLKWHELKRSDCSILLTYVQNAERFGFVETDDDGKIEAFKEKGGGKSGWINAGVYIIRREIIASLPGDRMISLEKEVFPHLTAKRFYGYKSYCSFIDIGTPESYEKAEKYFSDKSGDGPAVEVQS